MIDDTSPVPDDRSLGELFADLGREISTLVRQEATLAKAELSQKAARVGKDVGMLAVGGLVAYTGLLALVACVVILIAQAGLGWWGSTLLVGAVITCIGAGLVFSGLAAMKRQDLAPRETMETVKEDAQWIRRRAT